MCRARSAVPVVYFARNDRFDEYKMQSTTSLPIKQIKPRTPVACAGMVNAPSRGKPRNLLNFKAASLVSKKNPE